MKLFFVFCLSFISITPRCQGHIHIFGELSKIKTIPSWYEGDELKKKMDSTYANIIRLDTNAIIHLIDFLSDTVHTEIHVRGKCETLTYGQLAFLLINDIEEVPINIVTKTSWSNIGEFKILPYGFINYLNDNGKKFKEAYRQYFNSKERQIYIRTHKSRKIRYHD